MISHRPEQALISGYYGFGNTGDEAILQATLFAFYEMAPSLRLTVLSSNPEKTRKQYNVEAISRMAVFKIFSAMRQARIFLSGGGGLLQDATGWKSVYYYMGLVKLAKMAGCKTMIFGQGIGPLNGAQTRAFTKGIGNQLDLITVRDQPSARLLKEIGIEKPRILVTADMVFCLEPASKKRLDVIMKNEGITSRNPFFIVSVRPWKGSENHPERIGEAVEVITRNTGWQAVFIPFQPDQDDEVTTRAWKASKNCGVVLQGRYLPNELLSIFYRAHFTIGMRLHSLIFSTIAGAPSVGIVYDPKVRNFMDSINAPYVQLSGIDKNKILEATQQMLDNYERLSQIIETRAFEFRRMALENVRLAVELAGMKPAVLSWKGGSD
ncbi:MAG: polysaccharide pyruvyl transferase CsaB [Candidatus Eremiobacteraeota bacterium]|nr:polysaccharide pyruvyl transferase CsaB [Candidatus Eremiobacteraeota bacterium]